VYPTLSRVRVDERVMKILASVEIVGELADVAMRGARYGLPGWVTEVTQRNGRTKYGYLEKAQAAERAGQYLKAAAKPGEIAGRQLALLAMASYADQDAVAVSTRSWRQVKVSGPWAGELDELLDELVRDTLPDGALVLLAPVLDRRAREQQERAAARKARAEASARLEGIEERIGELTTRRSSRPSRTSTVRGPAGRRGTASCASCSPTGAGSSPRATASSQGKARPVSLVAGLLGRGCPVRCARPTPPMFAPLSGVRWVGDRRSHPASATDHEEAHMPAGITDSDSMFSVREVPWHGLGVVLAGPPQTISEAIGASGLRWRVEREPIAVDRREMVAPQEWWEPRCEEIPGYYANVRQDTRQVLGVVGERYRVYLQPGVI
jgi:hypothetical protein